MSWVFGSACARTLTHSTRLSLSSYASNTNLYDCTIVGGGIVGLATARELILRYPHMKFAVVEKEKELSMHQSMHNSGVIHAGIYYAPGSLKAKLCVEGLKRSYVYMDQAKIPYKKSGKLIVAVNDLDVSRLNGLMERAKANNVPGATFVSSDEIKEIEPKCVGRKAIYSPETGIVDWRSVSISFAKDFEKHGGKIYIGFHANSFTEAQEDSDYPVHIRDILSQPSSVAPKPVIQSKFVITCAGLQSDRVAQQTGCSKYPRIIPFRGDFLKLKDDKSDLVKTNIYPVPNPNLPFLGVHFTPRIDGSVWLGPNAILSLDREGYGRYSFKLKDAADVLSNPGFWKLASKYLTFGINEVLSDIFIKRQIAQLQRFVPSLQYEDVVRGDSGIRAQAINPDGQLVDDFVIDFGSGGIADRVMHVRNAPSPAATSSMAIACMIADKARKNFELATPLERNTV